MRVAGFLFWIAGGALLVAGLLIPGLVLAALGTGCAIALALRPKSGEGEGGGSDHFASSPMGDGPGIFGP